MIIVIFVVVFLLIVFLNTPYSSEVRKVDSSYENYMKVSSEYSRRTNIIFNFYREDAVNMMQKYGEEYNKFEKILDLKYPDDSYKNNKLSENIKRMEEKSKKVFELYKDIIPEFKKESRNQKLEEILS